MKDLGKVGLIGRFKPLHLGGAEMLEHACLQSEHVIIGVGSANKYNMRNPFTAEETAEMIDAYLSPRHANYEIVQVPDFAQERKHRDGHMWRSYIKEHFSELDHFISGNLYIQELLKDDYDVIESYTIVPHERRIPIKGAGVRYEMARGEKWRDYVPGVVAQYLDDNGLVSRFRKEFGLATLSELASIDFSVREDELTERLHTYER